PLLSLPSPMAWPARMSVEEMARLHPAYGTPDICSAESSRHLLHRLVHRQPRRHFRIGQTVCRRTEGQSAKTPLAISYLRSLAHSMVASIGSGERHREKITQENAKRISL